ncbi:MAG: twin-arginine translocation signal domain-containing protein, partial [Cyclobacteriaceae bacterium]|nr:twin-arginine translocation signal domain-containing protein [Cyclobacteriaceae bacterium]
MNQATSRRQFLKMTALTSAAVTLPVFNIISKPVL